MKFFWLLIFALLFIMAGCSAEKEKPPVIKPKVEEKQSNIDFTITEKWLTENKEYLKNQPTIGNENAPVTMVEFADFKCPYCGKWEEEVYPWLKEEYIDTGKVKLIFVNFPFIGPDSNTAAYAGEIIHKQNKDAFWVYYQLMYENRGNEKEKWATKEFIERLIKDVEGMDTEALGKGLDEEAGKDRVEEDRMFAMAHQISSTPSIIVNGYQIGNPFDKEMMKEFIEEYIVNE